MLSDVSVPLPSNDTTPSLKPAADCAAANKPYNAPVSMPAVAMPAIPILETSSANMDATQIGICFCNNSNAICNATFPTSANVAFPDAANTDNCVIALPAYSSSSDVLNPYTSASFFAAVACAAPSSFSASMNACVDSLPFKFSSFARASFVFASNAICFCALSFACAVNLFPWSVRIVAIALSPASFKSFKSESPSFSCSKPASILFC